MPYPKIIISKIFKYQGALQEHLTKLTRPQRVTSEIGKFILHIMDDTVTDTTTTPTTTTTSSIDTIASISNLAKFQCAANAKVPMKGVSWTDPKKTRPRSSLRAITAWCVVLPATSSSSTWMSRTTGSLRCRTALKATVG